MNETIKAMEDRINELDEIFKSEGPFMSKETRKVLTVEWREICNKANSFGYAMRRIKDSMGIRRIVAVSLNEAPSLTRNTECEYSYTNVRPDRKTLNGDCTTRALTFLMGGSKTYDEIEAEQYKIGARMKTRRNNRMVWTKIISDYGYRKISLRKTKRSVLGSILKNVLQKPIATVSSRHVAVLDVGGIVRDTWDSRGGRVNEIYAPLEQVYAIVNTLNQSGIACESNW